MDLVPTLTDGDTPQRCVHASHGDPVCALVMLMREHKAGPQIPVTVVQCRTHRRAPTCDLRAGDTLTSR